jgi:hypothetical protein
MTHDLFGGDDSFGAWLLEQSEIEEEERRRRKTKTGENVEVSDVDGEILEGDYSEDIEPDDFDD